MQHIGTQPFETERLLLRRFTPEDSADAHRWFCDSEVAVYMRWDAHTDIAQTEAFLASWIAEYEQPNFYRWAIALKEDNRAIGSIGFHVDDDYDAVADPSYALCKVYWGRGIVSEALAAVLRYALLDDHPNESADSPGTPGVGLNRVEAFHAVDNPGSGRVMQKAGMRYEGHARQKYRSHKGFEDCELYALLREDLL